MKLPKKLYRQLFSNSLELRIFGFIASFGILSYSVFLQDHFATDSYGTFVDGERHIDSTFVLARVLNTVLVKLQLSLGFNPVADHLPFTILSIILLAYAAKSLFVALVPAKASLTRQLSLISAVSLVVYSPYLVAMMVFPENLTGTVIGLVLNIYAGISFAKDQKRLGVSLAFASVFFYQSWIYVFAAIAILIHGRAKLRELIEYTTVIAVSLGSNLLLARLISSRTNNSAVSGRTDFSLDSIVANIKQVPEYLEAALVDYFGLLTPRFSLTLLGMLLVGILVFELWSSKKRNQLFFAMSMIAGLLVVGPLTPLIVSSGGSNARIFMATGLSFGITAAITSKYARSWRSGLTLASIGMMLIISATSAIRLGAAQQFTNQTDKQTLTILNEKIAAYEAQTGAQVFFLHITDDSNAQKCRVETCYGSAINSSPIDVNRSFWPTIYALEAYTGRSLKPNYKLDYEVMRNWDYFSPNEQIKFVDNTAVLIKF